MFQKKIAQSLCTTILQPYVTESCGFQQNVQKEIVYTTKASVRQLNMLCFAAGKWTTWKQILTVKSFRQIRDYEIIQSRPYTV